MLRLSFSQSLSILRYAIVPFMIELNTYASLMQQLAAQIPILSVPPFFLTVAKMTILFAASTVLIGPPGAATLTLTQVWAGLELKRKYVTFGSLYFLRLTVRHPELFLTVIDTCEVLEEMVRAFSEKWSSRMVLIYRDIVNLKLTCPGHWIGQAPTISPKVQERITHIKPLTVCFRPIFEANTNIPSKMLAQASNSFGLLAQLVDFSTLFLLDPLVNCFWLPRSSGSIQRSKPVVKRRWISRKSTRQQHHGVLAAL